jgi:hypothetical protein
MPGTRLGIGQMIKDLLLSSRRVSKSYNPVMLSNLSSHVTLSTVILNVSHILLSKPHTLFFREGDQNQDLGHAR